MPILSPLRCFLLVYFGVVVVLVVLVVVVVLVVTGVKQSQLLVPRLKSGLGTGVGQHRLLFIYSQETKNPH